MFLGRLTEATATSHIHKTGIKTETDTSNTFAYQKHLWFIFSIDLLSCRNFMICWAKTLFACNLCCQIKSNQSPLTSTINPGPGQEERGSALNLSFDHHLILYMEELVGFRFQKNSVSMLFDIFVPKFIQSQVLSFIPFTSHRHWQNHIKYQFIIRLWYRENYHQIAFKSA